MHCTMNMYAIGLDAINPRPLPASLASFLVYSKVVDESADEFVVVKVVDESAREQPVMTLQCLVRKMFNC